MWSCHHKKLEQYDPDAPESKTPGSGPFRNEQQEQEEGEVEIKLVTERPALQKNHGQLGWNEQIGRQRVELLAEVRNGGQRIVIPGEQAEGGVDPEDGKDASQAVIEKRACAARIAKLSCGDRGDDDPTDDEEEIDAECSMLKEEHVIGAIVLIL